MGEHGFNLSDARRVVTGIYPGSGSSMSDADWASLERFNEVLTWEPTSVSRTFTSASPAEQDMFGIPVHALPSEERPVLSGWRAFLDRHLVAYVRSSERYFPDDGPGRHAMVVDHGGRRIYMPAVHIERLREGEYSISTARSWVLWSPRLAVRAGWRAVRRPSLLLRSFERMGWLVRLLDRAAARRAEREEARRG